MASATGTGKGVTLLWALLYLGMIPGFAFVYAQFPNEFYHSTVVHEKYAAETREQAVSGLRRALADGYRQAAGSGALAHDGQDIHVDGVIVDNVEPVRAGFTFDAYFLFQNQEAKVSARRKFTFFLDDSMDLKKGDAHYYTVSLMEPAAATFILKAFPGDAERPSGLMHFLKVEGPTHAALKALAESAQGVPATLPGREIRMLYLSAMTATTVGYGDIVPLSDRARLLVGAEAVLGIIFIGLFLNSLTSRRE